jgi:hypothetical protein
VSDPKPQKQSKELPEAQRKAIAAEVEAFIARHPRMTLRQIAERYDVPHGMLSSMRKGNGIGILTLIRLRKLTGHTIDDMLRLDPIESDLERRIIRTVGKELEERASRPPEPQTPKGPLPDAPSPRPRRRP